MMINFIQILDWSIVFYHCSLPPLILNSLLPSNSRDTKPKKSNLKLNLSYAVSPCLQQMQTPIEYYRPSRNRRQQILLIKNQGPMKLNFMFPELCA